MKVKENVTIYQCEFCYKKLFIEKAMLVHEVKCSQNPLNIRACFDCENMERVNIKYEPSVQTYENDNLMSSTTFKCNAKKIFMFPPKFEHSEKGVPEYVEYNGEEITQESMPLNCEQKKHHKYFIN